MPWDGSERQPQEQGWVAACVFVFLRAPLQSRRGEAGVAHTHAPQFIHLLLSLIAVSSSVLIQTTYLVLASSRNCLWGIIEM